VAKITLKLDSAEVREAISDYLAKRGFGALPAEVAPGGLLFIGGEAFIEQPVPEKPSAPPARAPLPRSRKRAR
jgi:hypothetical protein